MADVATETENSHPMWIGWSSNLIPSDDCTREIWYLPQINQSPTSYAVVRQTMKKLSKISSECGKHNIAVTYDLAIAKLDLQIQAEESPEFDNIFVTLGSFRIELAFFNACGKIITESGALHFLNENLVLAAGSTNGFIKGKNYNRCNRIHELLSKAFENLHFQSNLAKIPNSEDVLDIIRSELNIILSFLLMSFSRSPIDLELKQTINAYAANQRTGISALTKSISARQRWTESHFSRMSVISSLITELKMTKKEDTTSTLKPHNIKNNNMCFGQIVDMIKANMNPFGTINSLYLFNIATGKSVSQKTEEFLLNISKIGEEEGTNLFSKALKIQPDSTKV